MRVRGHAAIPDSMREAGDFPTVPPETDAQLVGHIVYAQHADTLDASSTSSAQGTLHTNRPMSAAVQHLHAHKDKRDAHDGSEVGLPDVRGAPHPADLRGIKVSGMDADASSVEHGMAVAGAGLEVHDAVMDSVHHHAVMHKLVMHKLVSVALARLSLEQMGTAHAAPVALVPPWHGAHVGNTQGDMPAADWQDDNPHEKMIQH